VAADSRTNSVIVRADNPARLQRIQEMVQHLDSPTGAAGNIERSERLPALLSLGRVGRLALGAAARTDHPNSLAKLMRRRKPAL